MTNREDKRPDLTLDLIRRAVRGEKEATLLLLKRYDAKITREATIEEKDRDGNTVKRVDEDIKAEIQMRYVKAIRNWRELR